MKELLIGYIVTIKDNTTYIGGIMISDIRGIPVEFRYTEPIVPTQIQKILYGKAIDRYIFEEILIRNLSKEIQNKPLFYIVDYDEIDNLGKTVEVPVIELLQTSIPPIGEKNALKTQSDREALFQASSKGGPVRIKFGGAFSGKQDEIIEAVKEITSSFNILEPFDRINNALQVICSES